MNASAESDAEAGAIMAGEELLLKEKLELRKAEAEVLKAQLELRKAEIDAKARKAEIDAKVRLAEIDAKVRLAEIEERKTVSFIASGEYLHSSQVSERFPDIDLILTLAIIIVLSTITHSLIFCFFMEAFGTEFLESIRSAWVARFLTTLKSSGLYQVIVFMFEFLSRVGKRLLLKSQTANTPVSDEVSPLLGSDSE